MISRKEAFFIGVPAVIVFIVFMTPFFIVGVLFEMAARAFATGRRDVDNISAWMDDAEKHF